MDCPVLVMQSSDQYRRVIPHVQSVGVELFYHKSGLERQGRCRVAEVLVAGMVLGDTVDWENGRVVEVRQRIPLVERWFSEPFCEDTSR